MKALVYREYGGPERLALEEVPRPEPGADEVLLEVAAVALNQSDWEFLAGHPAYIRMWGLTRPRHRVLGSDLAGRVVAVGPAVTRFQVGDAVFGDVFERWGGLAEYVTAPERLLLPKPESLSFEQAAALPQSGVLALQGLRQGRPLEPGQRVLINGAGGGAGTFALQLARQLGAGEITGVDHPRKLELMRSLGADRVLDYTTEDFAEAHGRYDRILDCVATRSVFEVARALTRNGTYLAAGGSLGRVLEVGLFGAAISGLDSRRVGILMHRQNLEDIGHIAQLCVAGELRPWIERTVPLAAAAEAFADLGAGRVLGKIVVTP